MWTKFERFFFHTWKKFLKKEKQLQEEEKKEIVLHLSDLKKSLYEKNKQKATLSVKHLKCLSHTYLRPSRLCSLKEAFLAIIVAIFIAILIRQSIFELYEIPSGSMRPTLKEKDRLLVSKTQFSINIPLTNKHLLFDTNSVKRSGIVTFTAKNLDFPQTKTLYFYLFPGYKQYIKRMIGIPGDILYFYGGKIYGINSQGRDISLLLQRKELNHIEHIPFIHLVGKMYFSHSHGRPDFPIEIRQMNLPLVKLYFSHDALHYEWLISTPNDQFDLYKLWGTENFAVTKIIERDNLPSHVLHNLPYAKYYLTLQHHPSILRSKILSRTQTFEIYTETSYIPLSKEDLLSIWQHIYSGRFIVHHGLFRKYGLSLQEAQRNPYTFALPAASNIPDGIYEFTRGILYKVSHQGILHHVSNNHPLMQFNEERCLLFYNLGMELDTRFTPHHHHLGLNSSRYAYFREGDLFLMGYPIFRKNNTSLQNFIARELEKQTTSSRYLPFLDKGAPLQENGHINSQLLQEYGFKVPEGHYLVLGDNHAMSADSREFGCIPQDNLRGIPVYIFWAPGGRFGFPNHGIYPLFTWPRCILWSILILSLYIYRQYTKNAWKKIILPKIE